MRHFVGKEEVQGGAVDLSAVPVEPEVGARVGGSSGMSAVGPMAGEDRIDPAVVREKRALHGEDPGGVHGGFEQLRIADPVIAEGSDPDAVERRAHGIEGGDEGIPVPFALRAAFTERAGGGGSLRHGGEIPADGIPDRALGEEGGEEGHAGAREPARFRAEIEHRIPSGGSGQDGIGEGSFPGCVPGRQKDPDGAHILAAVGGLARELHACAAGGGLGQNEFPVERGEGLVDAAGADAEERFPGPDREIEDEAHGHGSDGIAVPDGRKGEADAVHEVSFLLG